MAALCGGCPRAECVSECRGSARAQVVEVKQCCRRGQVGAGGRKLWLWLEVAVVEVVTLVLMSISAGDPAAAVTLRRACAYGHYSRCHCVVVVKVAHGSDAIMMMEAVG